MLSIHWTRRHRCARIVCDTTPRHVKPCNGASFTCNCKLKIPMIHTFEVISKNEAIALAQCTYVICIIMTRHVNQNQSSTSPTWSSCKRSHVVFCYLRHINIFARWGNTKKKTEYNIFMDLIKPSPHQPTNKNWQLQWIADALRQKFWPSHTERLAATLYDSLKLDPPENTMQNLLHECEAGSTGRTSVNFPYCTSCHQVFILLHANHKTYTF